MFWRRRNWREGSVRSRLRAISHLIGLHFFHVGGHKW